MSSRRVFSKLWKERLVVGWLILASLGFFSLTVAVAGRFSPAPVLALSATISAVLFWIYGKSEASESSEWVKGSGWLFWIAVALSLPPGELLPGGWDPGVYLQTAVQISEQGSLVFDHPDLQNLSPEMEEILFRDVHGIPEPFGGMRLTPEGQVTPQFYHLYPAVMALVYGISGSLELMLLLNPLLAGCCVVLLVHLTARWTGSPAWGIASGLLYMVIPTQLWQFKFCTAEMMAQFFLLGGWWFLAQWSEDPQNRCRDAVCAGFSLGLAFLTRYDSIMVWFLLLPLLGIAWGVPKYRRGVLGLFLGAGPCAVLWWAHQQIAPYYSPLGPMVGTIAKVSLFLMILFAGISAGLPWQKTWVKLRTGVLWLATAGWACLMAGLWWIRPNIVSTGKVVETLNSWGLTEFASTLSGPSKVSILYLQSNFTWIGLLLIVMLIPVLWWKAANPARWMFALSGAGILLVLAWNPLNDLFMMWVARRFVPVVIPWIVVGVIVGLSVLQSWLKTWKSPYLDWIPVGVFVVLILLPLPKTWFQIRTRDWPGAVDWFKHTASVIPDDAVVVTDQPGFGSPLRFIWGKQAFELRRQKPELLRQLMDLHEQNEFAENLMFLTTSDILASEPGWIAVEELPMRSSIQSHHRYNIPTSIKSRGGDFVLYHWVGAEEE